MTILVLNSGSSSVKYRLYEMDTEQCLAWGLCERIGTSDAGLKHNRHDGHEVKRALEVTDHTGAIDTILTILLSAEDGVIQDKNEITAVGHRVVHGGEKFIKSAIIDGDVMDQLRACIDLAPLHNPPNIMGIEACMNLLGDRPQIAVFDTSFHQTMPDYAYLYGLPYSVYEEFGVRRYGFHGTSHRYVVSRAAALMKKPLNELKLISCHLGNGASVAAVASGKSIDTSMGMTPAEGLLMGTRTGDMDPAVLLYVMKKQSLDTDEANNLINKKSGVLGISGLTNDMREVEEAALSGHESADAAVNVYSYRLKKYIGAYAAAMGGIDGIIFTGGVGENSDVVRKRCLDGMDFLGFDLDPQKNDVRSKEERFIDTSNSKVRIMVIPTNEELVIARDTVDLIKE